jgi:hypothetical protein
MEILAISLAGLVLAYAVFNHFKIKKVTDKLNLVSDSHYLHTRHQSNFEEKTLQEIARVKYEIKKAAGKLTFHEKMTFKEALAINPKVEEVMGSMHVGGCPDCAVDLNETLEYGAAKNNVGVEEFLIALNNLPELEETEKINSKSHSALKIVS